MALSQQQVVPYEHASAGVLAMQAVDSDDAEPLWEQDPDWPAIFAHNEGRLTALRSWRYPWWQHWAILAQYILPYRYHWVVTANTYNRGFPVNDSIVNETATLAMRICAAGLLSGLMSPSRPWLRFDPAISSHTPDAQGRAWLDYLAETVLAVLAGSNWYVMGAQMFQDVATFGTSPMIIYEDQEDVIRCYVPCAGEYFLACGARLSVDTLYREFTYTVAQIVEFFQIDNCPEDVRVLWEEGGGAVDREFVIAHAIEPNFDIAQRGGKKPVHVVPGNFPWREVYWLRGRMTDRPLSVRGFHERPFMATRWSATSNDPYGRGPGMDALGGTRQLQIEEQRKGEYIVKGVRPPMVGDSTLENKPSTILPGEITFVNAADGKQQFYPAFEVSPQWLPGLTADIERVENRLNRAFYTDIFMMITQMEGVQPRTEFELAQRIGEKIQVLGPVIELFEQEVAPAIQRVISIMFRRGMLQPPPPSMRGIPVSITYTSMMKMAQRSAQTAAMERTFSVFGSLQEAAQAAGLPGPIRILNLDESAREYAELMGFPGKCIFSEKQVQQMDEAAEQQKQAAQAMQAAQVAQPAVQAAQGLSQIPAGGGNSALGQMLGNPNAGQQQQ